MAKSRTLPPPGCSLPDGQSVHENKCDAELASFNVLQELGKMAILLMFVLTRSRAVTHWFQNSASFERGPLVFALPINAEWTELKHYAAKSSDWQLTPKDDWNYAVVLSNNPSRQCAPKLETSQLSATPFDVKHPGVTLQVPARQLKPGRCKTIPLAPCQKARFSRVLPCGK